MLTDDPDIAVRLTAFEALKRLSAVHGEVLSYATLSAGFEYRGEKVHFLTKARGIFKPRIMTAALSVRSQTHVRANRVQRYADQRLDEGFIYHFQDGSDNRELIAAHDRRAPIIYFESVAEGHYSANWPAYIARVDMANRTCEIVIDDRAALAEKVVGIVKNAEDLRRQYATYEAKRRIHQEEFRQRVLHAYGCRCAVCGLPEARLIQAAHIIPDSDLGGEPVVPNGLALCSLHHGAFDAHMLGLRPDLRLVIADSLMKMTDGPTLKYALQGFQDQALRLPRRGEDRPRAEFVAERWARFGVANGG
jgi:putative restriction endonuclease